MKRLSLFLLFTAIANAGPDCAESEFLAEWKRTRIALERAGYSVNHFARTPFEIARKQQDIRRQIDQRRDSRAGYGAVRIGGMSSAGSSSSSSSKIRKAPPIGKLGASRKLR
ncbi:hypothetical protein ACFSSA_12210 [Luteolibacter algae]|uniref:DUF4148 domain-containing protein n=1 Tax=Luteolibacter algae TaxID=454151 RepID=A0ABW5D8N7_9BACT